jgi:hypothetical protein
MMTPATNAARMIMPITTSTALYLCAMLPDVPALYRSFLAHRIGAMRTAFGAFNPAIRGLLAVTYRWLFVSAEWARLQFGFVHAIQPSFP